MSTRDFASVMICLAGPQLWREKNSIAYLIYVDVYVFVYKYMQNTSANTLGSFITFHSNVEKQKPNLKS